jgi:hypothetical protein
MPLALTIFIALVVVVLGAIGYARDLLRSLLALLGTLFGALLVEFWGAQWGAALASRLGTTPQLRGFIVSCLIFLWGALSVGYGGGVLLGRSKNRPLVPQRLASALLGLLNGVLIVGFLLRYAFAQQPGFAALVTADAVAAAIYSGLPLLFLGLALAVTLLVVARGLVGLVGRRAAPAPSSAGANTPLPTRSAASTPDRRVDEQGVINKIDRQL